MYTDFFSTQLSSKRSLFVFKSNTNCSIRRAIYLRSTLSHTDSLIIQHLALKHLSEYGCLSHLVHILQYENTQTHYVALRHLSGISKIKSFHYPLSLYNPKSKLSFSWSTIICRQKNMTTNGRVFTKWQSFIYSPFRKHCVMCSLFLLLLSVAYTFV